MREPTTLSIRGLLILKVCIEQEGGRAAETLNIPGVVIKKASEGVALAADMMRELEKRLVEWEAARPLPTPAKGASQP